MTSYLFPDYKLDQRFEASDEKLAVWLNGALGNGPHLGTGVIIGSIDGEQVILVQDIDTSYQLLASQCHFGIGVPDEVSSKIAEGKLVAESIREYILAVRRGVLEYEYRFN